MFAKSFERRCVLEEDDNANFIWRIPTTGQAYFFLTVLALIIVLYSGLRSRSNDTGNYIYGYLWGISGNLHEIKDVLFAMEDGFGFTIYEIIVKAIFGSNYVRFLTVTALITCGSNIKFWRRYSSDFSLAIFLFITTTYYSFTMAAVRQCLAMAIGIWAIPKFIEKKWLKGVLIVLLAACIHQTSILYLFGIFLTSNIWNKMTNVLILVMVAISSWYDVFITTVAMVTGYGKESFLSDGTNIYRTFVWLVPVVLSFIYRKKFNRDGNMMSKTAVNLSEIGSALMILASFGAANLMGRAAYLFYPFFILALTEIIDCSFEGKNYYIMRSLCMLGFLMYFVILSKGNGGFWEDILRHNSIWALF
jgi:hypothetical protein